MNALDRSANSEEITISFYENEVPPFVEAEMVRLYESLYSSLTHFRIYRDSGNVSTYIVRRGEEIITIFLFQREQEKIRVINEAIPLDSEEISRFAYFVFSRFRTAALISFNAIQADLRRFAFPYQLFNCTEDVVLTLANSTQAYLENLERATRQKIKRHLIRLTGHFPSFVYRAYLQHEVDAQHIRDLVALSKVRMTDEDTVSDIAAAETEQVIQLTKLCGLVGVVTIDGRVCGGVISHRTGANYFSYGAFHDPAYDEHRLGMICCYLTICECIRRGGKEFHFMGGREEYKFTLSGVQRDLDHLDVYRSRRHFALHGKRVVQTAFKDGIRQAQLWLRHPKRQRSMIVHVANASATMLRNVQRFRADSPERPE